MKRIYVTLAKWVVGGFLMTIPTSGLAQEATEVGSQRVGDLEVTLLSAPPVSQAAMQKMMRGMGGMGGMQGQSEMPGMGGMMPGMSGMGGMSGGEGQPTHFIGVLVRDASIGQIVPGLDVTLTAQKGEVTWVVKLMPMPGSYGANISLPEKGTYVVSVTIARPGRPVAVAFEFDYK